MIAKALEIVYKSHKELVDKAGNLYILHLIRVAFYCEKE